MTSHRRVMASMVLITASIFAMSRKAIGAELLGRVLDEGGYAIQGAMVTAVAIGGPQAGKTYQAKTDPRGSFAIGEIPFGEYVVEASARGFVSVCFRPIKIAYLTVSWNARLPLAGDSEGGVFSKAELIGTLRIGSDVIPLATVCVFDGERRSCTVSNKLGEYHLKVDPGEYTATVVVLGVERWRGRLSHPQTGEYRDAVLR